MCVFVRMNKFKCGKFYQLKSEEIKVKQQCIDLTWKQSKHYYSTEYIMLWIWRPLWSVCVCACVYETHESQPDLTLEQSRSQP